MFRKFLMTSAGAFALVGPALAADLPIQPPIYTPPPFSWTGLYVGGQIGYAWGNDRANGLRSFLGRLRHLERESRPARSARSRRSRGPLRSFSPTHSALARKGLSAAVISGTIFRSTNG